MTGAPASPAAPSPGRRRRWLVGPVGLSLGHALAAWLLVLLHRVGEAWWLTTTLLYLPGWLLALPVPVMVWRLWRRGPRALLVTQAAVVVAVVFPLMGFVWPGSARPDPAAPVLRVLAYNVNHAYGGPERIVEEILRFRPDVVLLNKLNTNVAPVQALLRPHYPVLDASSGFLLATRHALVSRRDPDLEKAAVDRESAARFVRWELVTPLGPMVFYAVHPHSPRDGLVALLRGQGPGLLRLETAVRARQVRELAALADGESLPVVLAGDTNLPASSPLLRQALGRHADGFSAAGAGFGHTFPRVPFRWLRLDRILASPRLRFVAFTTGSSTASDHLCVVADLQLRR